jgi:predicted transcriptional regulator
MEHAKAYTRGKYILKNKNPKTELLAFRGDKQFFVRLDELCKKHNLKKSVMIRKAINELHLKEFLSDKI